MQNPAVSTQDASLENTGSTNLRRYLPYLVLLLPVLLVLPGLFSFPYPTHGESDLAVSHYPNAVYLLDAVKRWGEIPLWSPTILSGYPFFADPLAGLWYPPGWLAWLLPLPFGFNLLVALHLVWGGLGMAWLLRGEGLGEAPALLGGVAFACLPKLYAHFGAGHLTLLYAVPWTPWLLAAGLHSLRHTQTPGNPRFLWLKALASAFRFLLPGLVLALVFLADVRWAAYAGVLWWAYVFAHSHVTDWGRTGLRLLAQSAFALVLSAPLAVPLLEYTRLSTRAWMSPEDILVFSLPPVRLIWMLFPDIGGFHEYMLYPGAVVLVLALVAIANPRAKPGRLFWSGAFLLSLLFALGDYLPGMDWLVRLPGLDLLRVPSRALFISGMALASLAAYGLDGLFPSLRTENNLRITRCLVAFSTLAVALVVGIRLATGILAPNLVWGAGGIGLACLLVAALLMGSARKKIWLLSLFFLAVVDWSLVDRLAYTPRPVEQVLAQGAEAAEFLAAQPDRFRVYSPSYSLPQQTGARYRLEQAGGVDPLQLAAYAEFMQPATGVPQAGYSVTIPLFGTGSPQTDNIGRLPDPGLLGLLGVRYILSEFDLESEQLKFIGQFGETRLYENSLARPVAWVQPQTSPIGEDIQPVASDEWEPNQIKVQATGPGLLVLSEINYPGWKAWVDGEEVEVQTAGGLLRAVHLEPGEHQVVFRFQPASLYWGFAIILLGGSLGAILALFWAFRQHRSHPASANSTEFQA